MNGLKDYQECPIGEYVRIIQLADNPVDTLTDQELWVLYTKVKVDAVNSDSMHSKTARYLRAFETELINRGLLSTSQTSFFEGDN